MSAISRFSGAMRVTLFAVLGATMLDLSLMAIFGVQSYLLRALYACLLFWVAIVGMSLIVFWVSGELRFRKNRPENASYERYRRLAHLGILFCFIPIPWILFLSNVFGGPERVSSIAAFGPATAAFAIGIFLLIFSQIARWRLISSKEEIQESSRKKEKS